LHFPTDIIPAPRTWFVPDLGDLTAIDALDLFRFWAHIGNPEMETLAPGSVRVVNDHGEHPAVTRYIGVAVHVATVPPRGKTDRGDGPGFAIQVPGGLRQDGLITLGRSPGDAPSSCGVMGHEVDCPVGGAEYYTPGAPETPRRGYTTRRPRGGPSNVKLGNLACLEVAGHQELANDSIR